MIQVKFSSLKGILPHEWITRFLFGGAVCVLAGLVSKWFGPWAGGLFLAFPAIFPAGARLVEMHERRHKARVGLDGSRRGVRVAGVDAAGAAMGCIGLAGFALVCWACLPKMSAIAVFAIATATWFVLSISVWRLRKARLLRRRRASASHAFRAS